MARSMRLARDMYIVLLLHLAWALMAVPVVTRQQRVPASAAAWMALAALDAGNSADGVTQFTAGELSLHRTSGAAGCLQVQAELLMAPYCKDSFSFRGVRS